ncbi:MAG: hypothetical protein AAB602_03610 [Patescibacteria group bacterium]
MPSNWAKGFTKETHPSVLKISETMRTKKIDNFAKWRKEMKARGLIHSEYPEFERSGDLAELIGVMLGDGHICKFPRTESLRIVSNAKNYGFIKRYTKLVQKIFSKIPYVARSNISNATTITLYQKQISKRLGIPCGARKNRKITVPNWILANKKYIVRYLRGLYEAEGSFCVHKPTSTYKLLFRNRNLSMLANVFRLMKKFKFHPHHSTDQIQISRKQEVYKAMKLLRFRRY